MSLVLRVLSWTVSGSMFGSQNLPHPSLYFILHFIMLSLGVFTLLKHVLFCCQGMSCCCSNSSTRPPTLSTQTSKHACLFWPFPDTSFMFVYTPAFCRSCWGSSGTFHCYLGSVGSRKFHRPLVQFQLCFLCILRILWVSVHAQNADVAW